MCRCATFVTVYVNCSYITFQENALCFYFFLSHVLIFCHSLFLSLFLTFCHLSIFLYSFLSSGPSFFILLSFLHSFFFFFLGFIVFFFLSLFLSLCFFLYLFNTFFLLSFLCNLLIRVVPQHPSYFWFNIFQTFHSNCDHRCYNYDVSVTNVRYWYNPMCYIDRLSYCSYRIKYLALHCCDNPNPSMALKVSAFIKWNIHLSYLYYF